MNRKQMIRLRTIWIVWLCLCSVLGGHLLMKWRRTVQPPKIYHMALPDIRIGRTHLASGDAACSNERIFYRNSRMTEKIIYWNNQPWERMQIEYFDDLSTYSIQALVYQGDKVSIMRNDLFQSFQGVSQPGRKIKTLYYNFDKDRPNTLRQVDIYWPNTSLVKERQVFSEMGDLTAAALFEYDANADRHEMDENETIPTVTAMTLMNANGDIISEYRETDDVDLKRLYDKLGYSEEEIEHRIRVSKDVTRTPIMVMDGGIDISHPELAYKLWKNPCEKQNGKDDDGNGLADDIYGISDNPRLSQPVFDLRLPRFGLPTFSHGTLVASIATRGREDTAIISVSEMTTIQSDKIVPQIERLIKSHGVKFTNMSFIFDKQLLAHSPQMVRPHQIMELIENTPDTLHVVAAGNGNPISGKGYNMDHNRPAGDLVPAMLPHDNVLVVGALNTDHLELSDYPTYQLATFSNVGEISVDILAPGIQMCGARMGGGIVCDNGTSFAAPYVLNYGVLKVAKANPSLTILQIKEILMKSAYIPDLSSPLPVRSGGILHPKRAADVARWMIRHPNASVDDAVLAVRKSEPHLIDGENNSEAYLGALQFFWKDRQIGPSLSLYAVIAGP